MTSFLVYGKLLVITTMQVAAAVISASVQNDGDRGWTSFTLLLIELNIIVWVGYFSDRNAGNAVKELQVRRLQDQRNHHCLKDCHATPFICLLSVGTTYCDKLFVGAWVV